MQNPFDGRDLVILLGLGLLTGGLYMVSTPLSLIVSGTLIFILGFFAMTPKAG